MRYISLLLSKKLSQLFWYFGNTVIFKYGIFDFLYVHQVITSLARTGILFQNNFNIFKLLIIMLNSMFNKCKIKACVHYFLSSFYFIHEFFIPYKNLFSLLRYSNFCNFFPSFPHYPDSKKRKWKWDNLCHELACIDLKT